MTSPFQIGFDKQHANFDWRTLHFVVMKTVWLWRRGISWALEWWPRPKLNLRTQCPLVHRGSVYQGDQNCYHFKHLWTSLTVFFNWRSVRFRCLNLHTFFTGWQKIPCSIWKSKYLGPTSWGQTSRWTSFSLSKVFARLHWTTWEMILAYIWRFFDRPWLNWSTRLEVFFIWCGLQKYHHQDYADFVNLSTNLVGLDGGILALQV